MSKKDYQAIARGLYLAKPAGAPLRNRLDQWRVDVDAIAAVLAAGNPRFDRDLFREACETGKCKGMRPVAA